MFETTAPEIAWTGKTEEEVKASGRAYKVGSFPFMASGRAKAMEQTSGMVKIVSSEDDDDCQPPGMPRTYTFDVCH